jgi:hypothetical protein
MWAIKIKFIWHRYHHQLATSKCEILFDAYTMLFSAVCLLRVRKVLSVINRVFLNIYINRPWTLNNE